MSEAIRVQELLETLPVPPFMGSNSWVIGPKKTKAGKVFNVGPFPVNGNNEVLNNLSFLPTADGRYKVKSGPAKRRIIDFADIDHSVNILPTGQSGNPTSPHYSDQAEMFVNGEFRLQKTKASEIKTADSQLLVLMPQD